MAPVGRLAIAASLLVAAGCDRSIQFVQKSPQPETYFADPGSLGFGIDRVQENREFIATYTAHGKTAKFRIQLDPAGSTAKNFEVGKGRFLPEPGSDRAAILGDLASALNQAIQKGEFSMKDPDYGDYLIAQLARIL